MDEMPFDMYKLTPVLTVRAMLPDRLALMLLSEGHGAQFRANLLPNTSLKDSRAIELLVDSAISARRCLARDPSAQAPLPGKSDYQIPALLTPCVACRW
jgi:hypothetical protein